MFCIFEGIGLWLRNCSAFFAVLGKRICVEVPKRNIVLKLLAHVHSLWCLINEFVEVSRKGSF